PALRRALLLGQAEVSLGHDAEAEAALREALQLEPGNVKAAYLLGRLLVRAGRVEEGQALLKRVAGP
ncbi:MAG: tetratricopeptide repeat protein, partial [Planctomycetes bacterium]|nr:tetratricopeptide repeat protein [Planctomycetota bacterium]